MDNNALIPEISPEFQLSQEASDIQAPAIKVAQEEDKELASLLANRGFQRLMAEMKVDIEKFKTGVFIKDIEKMELAEVGKMFVIHQTVASMLESYLTKVENAAKAVADAERK